MFEFRSNERNERHGGTLTHEIKARTRFSTTQVSTTDLDQMFQSLRDSAGVMAYCTGLEQTLDEKGATDYDVSRVVANQNVLLMN